jgi:hypothetical protein
MHIRLVLFAIAVIVAAASAQNVELVGALDSSTVGRDIYIQNGKAYIADWNRGLAIVDISNPAFPILEQRCALPWYAYSIEVDDGYAYVADIGASFLIIDLTSDTIPQLVGSYYYSNWCFDVDVQANRAYVAFGGTDPPENRPPGMGVFDVTDRTNPSLAAFYETYDFARAVEVRDTLAYIGIDPVVNNDGAFQVINISDPTNPAILGQLMTSATGIVLKGDYAYTTQYSHFLQIIDILDPFNPVLEGQYNLGPEYIFDIFVRNQYVYVISHSSGLSIFDVSDNSHPILAGRYVMDAASVFVEGGYIYTAGGSPGLAVFSFTPRTGCLAGTVFSSLDGSPADGVIVSTQPSPYIDTTDSAGRFFFESIPNFPYDLTLEHPDYFDTTMQDVVVNADDTTNIDIVFNHRPSSDVGVSAILSPRWNIMDGGRYPLISEIINVGFEFETFDVIYEVWLGDSSALVVVDTVTVLSMPPVSKDTVVFSESLLAVLDQGYLFRTYSLLADDENPNNDLQRMSLTATEAMYLIFGNRDGAPMPVQPGQNVEIPIWGATARDNFRDSIIFMHVPLASNDSVVAERLGGYFEDTLVGYWDDRSYLAADSNSPEPGWTNQSLLAFAYVIDPRDPQNFFWTNGDTLLIGACRMRLSDDPELIGRIVCPFREGWNPPNGGLLWGCADAITALLPITTYPCLSFDATCQYVPGDINNVPPANGIDITYGVSFLKGGIAPPVRCDMCPQPPPFYAAGDVNGSCVYNGIDITYFVSYLKGGPGLLFCPSCPPVGQ